MSGDLPCWAKEFILSEDVVYVGKDGWEPDPLFVALQRKLCKEYAKVIKEKTGQDLNAKP